MKIMIVGANGFLGSALVPALMADPRNTIYALDIGWFDFPFPTTFRSVKSAAFYYLKGDAAKTAPELLRTAGDAGTGPFDAVIYLAGMSNDPMADFAPHLNYAYNAALPAFLAHEARNHGVRAFIHAGSCSVYGYDRDVTESTPPKTFSPYGVSKLMGESGCLQQGQDSMRVVAFRMGTVCGPSPRMRLDLIINAMVKDALTKREIFVNDAEAERPILDIRDAVGCYVRALTLQNARGVYNLLSENANVYEIAQRVEFAVSTRLGIPVAIRMLGKRDVRSYSASAAKACAAGFEFTHTIDDTVRATLDALLLEKRDLEDACFYNIRCFKKLKLAA